MCSTNAYISIRISVDISNMSVKVIHLSRSPWRRKKLNQQNIATLVACSIFTVEAKVFFWFRRKSSLLSTNKYKRWALTLSKFISVYSRAVSVVLYHPGHNWMFNQVHFCPCCITSTTVQQPTSIWFSHFVPLETNNWKFVFVCLCTSNAVNTHKKVNICVNKKWLTTLQESKVFFLSPIYRMQD